MFEKRSQQKEFMDDLSLGNLDLEQNLFEIVKLNDWFGSKAVLISSLNDIYKTYLPYLRMKKIVIADLGCGSGDLVNATHQWLSQRKISADLLGIDANSFMLEKATINYNHPNIQYRKLDIFTSEFAKMQFDIVTLNSICHHFDDGELIKLLNQLAMQTRLAIIINDLHRNRISYLTIKYLAKCFNLSYLAQHDGPLSVLRAFKKHELVELMNICNLKNYQIRWAWAFRWQLIIWLSPSSIKA